VHGAPVSSVAPLIKKRTSSWLVYKLEEEEEILFSFLQLGSEKLKDTT
jgi:hypothetical protein